MPICTRKAVHSFKNRRTSLPLVVAVMGCLLPIAAAASPSPSQQEEPAGLAWQVNGTWQAAGVNTPLRTGDPILAGWLLQPAPGTSSAAITVLLPDGQRILYECSKLEDCARGFRVPALYRIPDAFAVETLARIRAAIVANRAASAASHPPAPLPRDEALAQISEDKKVQIGGLASHLPDGHYTYDLQPLDPRSPTQLHLALEKTATSVTFPLPGPGLYKVRITDDLNMPRIDVFIAALAPAQGTIQQAFNRAKKLLGDWNDDYYGWPFHDFQRAYLESYFLTDRQEAPSHRAEVAAIPTSPSDHDTAAEPEFSPKPGVFPNDLAVSLHCDTVGAVLHFTVDSSQPLANSPVYGAPIIVKGTELTIKAFASAPGKKDSPVVTGIFRIHE